jgi:hypothetical protein
MKAIKVTYGRGSNKIEVVEETDSLIALLQYLDEIGYNSKDISKIIVRSNG